MIIIYLKKTAKIIFLINFQLFLLLSLYIQTEIIYEKKKYIYIYGEIFFIYNYIYLYFTFI